MHLILTGATGLVGGACLHSMLRNPEITRISVIGRRPPPLLQNSTIKSDKCNIITHLDFSKPLPAEVLEQVKDAKGCVWALGVSSLEVQKDKYERITVDWPLASAKALTKNSNAPFNFVYVSGEGATTEPTFSTQQFGRVKGAAEVALLKLPAEPGMENLRPFSARPAAVDPTFHPELREAVQDRPKQLWKRVIERPVLVVFRAAWKNMVSPTNELGDALVKLAAGNGERFPDGPGVTGNGRILGNAMLRKMEGI